MEIIKAAYEGHWTVNIFTAGYIYKGRAQNVTLINIFNSLAMHQSIFFLFLFQYSDIRQHWYSVSATVKL